MILYTSSNKNRINQNSNQSLLCLLSFTICFIFSFIVNSKIQERKISNSKLLEIKANLAQLSSESERRISIAKNMNDVNKQFIKSLDSKPTNEKPTN